MNNQFFRRYLAIIFIIFVIFIVINAAIKITKTDVVETNILSLLPQNRNNDILKHVDEKLFQNIEKRLVYLIGSSTPQTAVQNVKNISSELSQSDLFELVEETVNTNDIDDLVNFYKTQNAPFLSLQHMAWLENNNMSDVRAHVLSKVYGIGGGIINTNLQRDPLFFLNDYIGGLLQNSFKNFDLIDDIAVIKKDNTYYGLVRAKLLKSPFSIAYQGQAIKFLDQMETDNADIKFIRSSLLFHANHGTEIAKSEINRMGLASIISVFLLFLIAFKTIRPFALVLITIAGGGIAGASACLLFFNTIYLLTLVFGISLVGISIDYVFHFFTEKYNESKWNANQAIKNILPGVTMGLVTSIFGFLGLCLTPITILQQMAVFCIAGLCFVYACVVLFYPMIFRVLKTSPNQFILTWSEKYIRFLKRISSPKIIVVGAVLSILLFASLPFFLAKDDIRAMQTPSSQLIENDLMIGDLLGSPLSAKIMVIQGDTDDKMLEKLHDFSKKINGSTSLSQYVFPHNIQNHNKQLLDGFLRKNEIELKVLFEKLGYTHSTFKDYLKFVDGMNPIQLNDFFKAVNNEDIHTLYSNKYIGKSLGLIVMKGEMDKKTLQDLANADSDVFFIDKIDALSSSLNNTRFWASILAVMAYGIISLLLIIRYGLIKGITIVMPCVLSALLTLLIICVFNGSYGLFHVLALFLVMGIGVDYGLFLIEGMKNKDEQKENRIMTAIILSAITTLMSFGLLSTSATSALHDFGITVILGIVMVFFLSPCMLLALSKTKVNK